MTLSLTLFFEMFVMGSDRPAHHVAGVVLCLRNICDAVIAIS
jgi:hypothetical protein